MKSNKSVEPVIDYLAVEIAREEALKAWKAGKHARVAKMLTKLTKAQPAPMVDLLAVFGD